MEYGLIGEKLGHSFSEIIHREFGEYDYRLHEIPRGELDAFMAARDFPGDKRDDTVQKGRYTLS